jgi:hypothetical protein
MHQRKKLVMNNSGEESFPCSVILFSYSQTYSNKLLFL